MPRPSSHNGTDLPQCAAQCPKDRPEAPMPTLFRFVVTLAVLAGIAYGAMFALVMFVQPKQAELSVRIPAEKLAPKP